MYIMNLMMQLWFDKEVPSPGKIRLLLGALVALMGADGVFTRFLLDHGLASEGNPLLQGLITQDHFLIVKFVGACLAALVLWDIGRRHPKLSLTATTVAVILYSVILYWNLSIYFLNG